MINIKILGKKYSLPSLKEISINRFIDYLNFSHKHTPECLRSEEVEYNPLLVADYAARELAFWTGCPLKHIRRHDLSEVYAVWSLQQRNLAPTENITFNCVEIEGVIYYLPEKFMTNSTIEDFAEASEYEKQLAEVQNGSFVALPKVASILLRKKGEGFDDYNVEQRAELIEKHLTADDLLQIGFFLQRQSEKLAKDFQIYTTSMTLAQLKQVYANY